MKKKTYDKIDEITWKIAQFLFIVGALIATIKGAFLGRIELTILGILMAQIYLLMEIARK